MHYIFKKENKAQIIAQKVTCIQCKGSDNFTNCSGTGEAYGFPFNKPCKKCYDSNGRCRCCKEKGYIFK